VRGAVIYPVAGGVIQESQILPRPGNGCVQCAWPGATTELCSQGAEVEAAPEAATGFSRTIGISRWVRFS
jgi:hypothetical protein